MESVLWNLTINIVLPGSSSLSASVCRSSTKQSAIKSAIEDLSRGLKVSVGAWSASLFKAKATLSAVIANGQILWLRGKHSRFILQGVHGSHDDALYLQVSR